MDVLGTEGLRTRRTMWGIRNITLMQYIYLDLVTLYLVNIMRWSQLKYFVLGNIVNNMAHISRMSKVNVAKYGIGTVERFQRNVGGKKSRSIAILSLRT